MSGLECAYVRWIFYISTGERMTKNNNIPNLLLKETVVISENGLCITTNF